MLIYSLLCCFSLLPIERFQPIDHPTFEEGKPTEQIQVNRRFSKKGNVQTILIPSGPFMMGGKGFNEAPPRRIFLDSYFIGKTDVTVAQFKAYCIDKHIDFSKFEKPMWGWIDNHPMVNITWQQARDYCKWAGGDLPSEAQWEKAARGEDGRIYPWGNKFDRRRLWTSKTDNGQASSTVAVGSFPTGSSPSGCLDMAGNVLQWCLDWFSVDSYSSQPSRNPHGPKFGGMRVLRCGSLINYDPDNFRCSHRYYDVPANRNFYTGFRLAAPR